MRAVQSAAFIAMLAFPCAQAYQAHGESAAASGSVNVDGKVLDPSGKAMPAVSVTFFDGIAQTFAEITTDGGGDFSVALRPGQYQMAILVPDLKPFVRTVEINLTTPPMVISLSLDKVTSVVDVQDKADPVFTMNSIRLSGESLRALPFDQGALLNHLQLLADGGGHTQFTVDGFPGGSFPSLDQISEIVVERNSLSASGTGPRIMVLTKTPGLTRWAGSSSIHSLNRSMNARNRGALNTPSRQGRVFTADYSGPLIKGKLGMGISLSMQNSRSEGNHVRAVTPEGTVSYPVIDPAQSYTIGLTNHWYLSPSSVFGYRITRSISKHHNQGVGGFTLAERAFDSSASVWNVQVLNHSSVTARLANELRLNVNRTRSSTCPLSNAITIDVLDSFHRGGAQNRSTYQNSIYDFGDAIRWAPVPKWTVKVTLDGTYRKSYSDSDLNSAGTFTFSSLEDYLAGQPLQFSKASGRRVREARQLETNASLQADYSINGKASLRMGSRYTWQTSLGDYNNLGPVAQFSYQLRKRTGISFGAALSYPVVGLSMAVREQLLRQDGSRPFETIISNPSYPDPFVTESNSSPQLTGAGLILSRAKVFESAYRVLFQMNMQQSLKENWRVSAHLNLNRDVHQLRTRNINAPYPGTPFPAELRADDIDYLRPYYPLLANITHYESVGKARSNVLDIVLQSPAMANFKRFQWSGDLRFVSTWAEDDSVAQNPYDRNSDWARSERLHRLTGNLSVKIPLLGSLFLPVSLNSGNLYSVTTGRDDNFDLSLNDRPIGIKRNSLRGPPNFNVNLAYISPVIGLLPAKLVVQVTNLLNNTTISEISGVMTSPFFGQPTSFGPSRSVRLALSLSTW